MKIEYRILLLILFSLSYNFLLPRISEGFNDAAHRNLSLRATQPQVSNLDGFLKSTLASCYPWSQPIPCRGFPDGILQRLLDGENGTVRELIARVGAVNEDFLTRPLKHFHNPRLAWNQAGLFSFFESSIVWS